MSIQLQPLQCLTNAPVDYDYGWQTTLVENVATDSKGRPWRLCENADQWHLDQQAMRYGSGLHQCLTKQEQVDEWFEHGLLTPTGKAVPIIRLSVNLRPYLEAKGEERSGILEAIEPNIPGVTVETEQGGYLRIFTCRGIEAAQALRQHLQAADLEFEPYGPQPGPAYAASTLDTAE